MSNIISNQSNIKKVDKEKRIIYGEVYTPNTIDTDGESMTAEEIEILAHRFMTLPELNKTIDTMHDNVPNECYPVESFIARKNDPDGYTEGSWVLATKIVSDDLWGKVKRGELNGYSMEAMVKRREVETEIEMYRDNIGVTEKDYNDGHQHAFFVQLGEDGRVVHGFTSETNGHKHVIGKGTATEQANGHKHRYFVEG